VLKPNYMKMTLDILWQVANHDLSSSVTGSSVFDFEGDGRAEVIYGDECFLWVFDGKTGQVRFATSHTSFTATEASLVADVDGDGRAEMVMVSNGASPVLWQCVNAMGTPSTVNGVRWTPPPMGQGPAYRGITVLGDRANGWVGTRTLWNQHAYHVTNICDSRDTACNAPSAYGAVPRVERSNWSVPWLDNYRQNVQDKGLFDAPDAVVSLSVECVEPVVLNASVRNIGLASLPAGVVVQVFKVAAGGRVSLGSGVTTHPLYPGQTEVIPITAMPGAATTDDTFIAAIVVDAMKPTFRECRSDNDESAPTHPNCVL
jgi:FG-GAP-like repeat